MAKGPTLTIPAETYTYIKACVKKAGSSEVGGLGIILVDAEGFPYVAHHRLLTQKVSAGEVEWDEAAHSDYLEWLYKPEDDGGAGFTGNSYGLYSWHSHGAMTTFFSGTDEDFIRRAGSTAPYIFSSVFNKHGSSNHRLDGFLELGELIPIVDTERTQITWKDCGLYVQESEEVRPLVDEIGEIEDMFTQTVDTLRKEKDSALKELRQKLTEMQKVHVKDVEKEVDDDFKEFVSMSFTGPAKNGNGSGTKGGHNTDPKAPSSKDSAKSQSPSSSGKEVGPLDDGYDHQSWEGVSGLETKAFDGTEEPDALAAALILNKFEVSAYDITAKRWGRFTLKDMLNDDDLVPGTDFPEEILETLPDDIHIQLLLRPTYSEWITGELKYIEAEEKRNTLN